MTESGQEPPETGRRAADASEESGTRTEFRGKSRRRRKRRPGQGSKGGTTGQGPRGLSPSEQTGEIPARDASGHVNYSASAQAQPVAATGDSTSAGKKRKKRRRGRSATANHTASVAGDQSGAAPNPEPFTSIKGKKAANRRGRRRWQASKNAKNGAANSTENDAAHRDGTHVQQSPEPVDRHDRDRQAKEDADIRLPQTGPGLEKDLKRRVPGGRRYKNGHHNSPLYAALDLGTNNCRLLIARPENRGFRVVDAYSRIVRLGEGVGSNKCLSSAAMDRAIDALANCHKKLADRGVLRSRLIATEACRAAENGSEFIERVRAETGLALEIVDRETEARLAVAGCASLVDHEADGVILFDIGGGSSEIVWLDLRNRCGARGYALTRFIRSWISLPVGVVNLAERHGGVHVTPDIFEAMVEDAAEHLSSFGLSDTLSEAITSGRVHMLGTSGTVTTLAGVHLGLRRYDRRKVDGTWLDDHDVAKMIDQLRDMPYEARVDNPCIGADRADLVLAGCAILEAIRRRWTCSRLRVADRGLREGILTELMAADGVWANKRQGRRQHGRRQRNRA